MRFPRNTATFFALGGYVLAAAIAWTYLGWFWVYLPGALAALVAGYGVSTWLGAVAARNTRRFVSCLMAGVGVALATLVAGVLSLGAINVFLAWLDDVIPLRMGFGPYSSLAHALFDWVVKPMYWVLLFGGWIAILLGVVYGMLLWSRGRAHRAARSPAWSSQ